MYLNIRRFSNRFVWLEIAFFLGYFLFFPLSSDIEFNLREGGSTTIVLQTLPYRIVSGIGYLVPYWVYYKLLLQRYLFRKRYLLFGGLLFCFLLVFNFYTPLINGLVSQISFSPVNFISSQGINFKKSIKLNFSLFYICRELLVISALGYFIKSAKQEQQLQRIHKQQLQAELTYLKVQLQPHFFFNTLNNIYALILQDSVQAAPLVARLAEMMRYIIYEASKPLVQLQQEIDFLKHYVAVEAVRYSGQTRILFDTQGIRDTAQIEPLLLLPLVENSFKHGLAEETNAGFVQIIISLMGKELFTEISNSKAGLVRNPPKGIGLENVLKRLDLLYPGRYTMEINNGETVYELRLTIQLKSHDTVPYSG